MNATEIYIDDFRKTISELSGKEFSLMLEIKNKQAIKIVETV